MALVEEDHDLSHLLPVLFLRQLRPAWSIRLYRDVCSGLRHYAHESLWLDLLPEYHVWLRYPTYHSGLLKVWSAACDARNFTPLYRWSGGSKWQQ